MTGTRKVKPPFNKVTVVEECCGENCLIYSHDTPSLELLNEHIKEMNIEYWDLVKVEAEKMKWICLWKKQEDFEEY